MQHANNGVNFFLNLCTLINQVINLLKECMIECLLYQVWDTKYIPALTACSTIAHFLGVRENIGPGYWGYRFIVHLQYVQYNSLYVHVHIISLECHIKGVVRSDGVR